MSLVTASRRRRGTHLAAAAALAAVFLLPAAPARADGDPASDFLLTLQAFVPFDARISMPLAERLIGVVRRANDAGYEIRVAVIATPYDLGAVQALWLKPREYARFLGQEIRFAHPGRLLIAMPNGFGFNSFQSATDREARLLQDVRVLPGSNGLARSTIAAVIKLAAAEGINVKAPPLNASAKRNKRDRVIIIVGVALIVLLLAAMRYAIALTARRARRRSGHA